VLVYVQAFATQKAGSTWAEYEDAVWPDRPIHGASFASFRCAVADGATETSYSRLWAHQLVGAYSTGALNPETLVELPALQRKWQSKVGRAVRQSTKWWTAQKAASGAFAAFVGLEISSAAAPDPGTWRASALGDCCLFQVRDDELIFCFPLTRADEFNDRPLLLPSLSQQLSDVPANLKRASATWVPNDTFFMLSDAIAHWFLLDFEGGGKPWSALRDLGTDEAVEFRTWIDSLRASGVLKNDDVTVLRVDVLPGRES
jgi:hypothetical protein